MTDRYTLAEIQALNGKSPGIESKARRLLADGAVDVTQKTARTVTVEVGGDTGRHKVTADSLGWTCNCAAFTNRRRCSHVIAAQLVVAGPGYTRLPPLTPTTHPTLTDAQKGHHQ